METRKGLEVMFHGGSIYADDAFMRKSEALGIRGGRIVAVGSMEELDAMCDGGTVRRNLKEKCVLPGFLDPHSHFAIRSLTPLMADCRTPPVQSVGEILKRMQEQSEHCAPGGWVVGWGYEENLLKERRGPTREELGDACRRSPAILMHSTFSKCMVNSLALEYCGIDRFSEEPLGGRIVRDMWGTPNGMLLGRAAMLPFELARRDLFSRFGRDAGRLFRESVSRLLRFGVVRVSDAAMWPQEKAMWDDFVSGCEVPLVLDRMRTDMEDALASRGALPPESPDVSLPVVKLTMDGAGHLALEVSMAGFIRGLGDSLSKVVRGRSLRSVCRSVRDAEARLDRVGKVSLGFLLNDRKQIEDVVAHAHRCGYPVATHAHGNSAIGGILEIYERVQDRYGEPKRPFRVEHAMFLTEDLIAKMARLKVAAVVQPALLNQYRTALDSLPLPRGLKVLPLRSMIDAGILLSGSSDGLCAHEDPLTAMDCAYRRIRWNGERLDASEAIDVDEAIKLYTVNAARVMGCDHETGSLQTGKRADMVILSGDPRAKGFDKVRVTETVVSGQTAWKRGMSLASNAQRNV